MSLTRSVEPRRCRLRPAWTAGLAAGVFAAGMLAERRATVISVPVPVAITAIAPPSEPPTVNVTNLVPEPPAPPEKPPPEPPQPRRRSPRLWSDCVLPAKNMENARRCSDDGFPAISADGTRIAVEGGDDDPSGSPTLSVQLVDPETSKVVGTYEILAGGEEADRGDPGFPALQARIARRVRAVQHMLDEQRFRSLLPFGWSGTSGASSPRRPGAIYADIAGDTVRVVEPISRHVIWEGSFGVPAPRGLDPETDDCAGWHLRWMEVWWDPETRFVLSSMSYETGGCMCPDVEELRVARMPS